MAIDDSLAGRTRHLLDTARYLNLATVTEEGTPWVATLEYAWFARPLRFVFGSAAGSQHGRDVAAAPRVSGSLFVTGGVAGVEIAAVDGAQFTGRCAQIPPGRLGEYHAAFYEAVFPDPRQRARWSLPPASLRPPAPHRLYLVEVERWWLIDTRTWERDRVDRRVEMPLDAGTQALLSGDGLRTALS
jgi:uncharacterized protein YhbP (UPF0306 family)